VTLEGADPAAVPSPAAPVVPPVPAVGSPSTVFLAPLNLTPTESLNQF
jgi:hypothetical protein